MLLEAVFMKGYIIPCLIFVLAFLLIFRKAIKNKPILFYIIFAVITVLIAKLFISRSIFSVPMKSINSTLMYWINMYRRGTIGFVMFLVVMLLGVVDKKKKLNLELISIRGPLSIIASIASLCHLIIYGEGFISKYLKGGKIDSLYFFLFITSAILLIIMLPLFITSFVKIRKKMNPIKWHRLQKYAYAFYFILFINVISVFIRRMVNPKFTVSNVQGLSTVISLSVYIVLALTYTFMLIKREKSCKNSSCKKVS